MPALAPFRPTPWVVVAAACAAVLALAVVPPFVDPPVRAALMYGFHAVCHQLPARSFAVGGVPLALCHRCLGVVAGLLVGVLLVPLAGRWRGTLVRFERPVFLLVLALAAADWLLGLSGLWANVPASRLTTGGLVGLAAGYLLARAVAAPEATPEPAKPGLTAARSPFPSPPSPHAHAQQAHLDPHRRRRLRRA